MNTGLLFLCGMAAVPACTGEGERDVTQPGNGDFELLEQTCGRYLETLYGCYDEELMPELADEYCATVAGQYEPECGAALEEVLACLATVDCDEIQERSPEHPCAAVGLASEQTCIDAVNRCEVEVDQGNETCGLRTLGCFDGKSYAAACSVVDEGASCTCEIDGVESMVSADFACHDVFSDDATVILDACGFPRGLQ